MNDDRRDGYGEERRDDEPLIAGSGNLPAIPEEVRHFSYEAPITRDEFNRLSAIVAELRNRMDRVEAAAERLIRSQWGAG